MEDFVCKKCGSSDLGYAKIIKHITPVRIDNRILYYDSLKIRVVGEEESNTFHEFCCQDCGESIDYLGPIRDEAALIDYLTIKEQELWEIDLWAVDPDDNSPDDNENQ